MSSSAMRIEAARRSDLAGIRWLLEYEQLPANDLDESSLERFLVCRDEKGVVAAVGLEIFGRVALLRSLVVDREMRGRGMGMQLTEAAEALAHHSGVESIYLLTTTAEEFFRARGYRILARSEAPAAIQSTTQFSALCPSTAILMVKP
jgi:amino-acid N-acetyltransferase